MAWTLGNWEAAQPGPASQQGQRQLLRWSWGKQGVPRGGMMSLSIAPGAKRPHRNGIKEAWGVLACPATSPGDVSKLLICEVCGAGCALRCKELKDAGCREPQLCESPSHDGDFLRVVRAAGAVHQLGHCSDVDRWEGRRVGSSRLHRAMRWAKHAIYQGGGCKGSTGGRNTQARPERMRMARGGRPAQEWRLLANRTSAPSLSCPA